MVRGIASDAAGYTTDNRYRVTWLSQTAKYFLRRIVGTQGVWLLSIGAYVLSFVLPPRLVKLDRPIFVIGAPRSGTTLFSDMLARHRDIFDWSEAGQIWDLHFFDDKRDHEKTQAAATDFEQRRLRVIFGLAARFARAKRLMNKHPRNSLRIAYMKAIFPDCKIIHLVRDGRAVALSCMEQIEREPARAHMAMGGFVRPPGWQAHRGLAPAPLEAWRWATITNRISEDAAKFLAPKDYLEVRYEDFCADPHACIARIDAFAGLAPGGRVEADLPKLFPTSERWRKRFPLAETAPYETIMMDTLRRCGYGENTNAAAPEGTI